LEARTAVQDGRYSLVDVGIIVVEERDQDIDLGTGISSPVLPKRSWLIVATAG
jgi:hypothetical protein